MNQSSEDRLHGPYFEPKAATARIIPFERPPTDLQRAVQLRAQEALDRDRDRQRTKPAPLRWAVILLLAMIPVVLIFAAVDAFVRVFHHVNASFSTMPEPSTTNQAPRESASQPGVVMLSPLHEEDAESPKTPPAPDTD